MNLHVIGAVLRRNLVSYFSNPTGYVFICVFVLMGSFAAFWPNAFFNDNLANLDQLNKSLPYILLVFIPAITMSIWAEERRQGTDELLLTIPATDFDVVIGKYLAAVGIYLVSLVFSGICNLIVLFWLSAGDLDFGLFFANYFGYAMVGMSMLAIGMAASFLTGNLTVGFVLGVIFNVPLVFAAMADSIPLPGWAAADLPHLSYEFKRLSLSEQFRDYGRGVITLSSIVYFLSLAAVMLYVSMVFIGRRHWSGGRDGQSMGWHYLARFLCLLAIIFGANVFLRHHDRVRLDATSEGLSSLSPETRKLIRELNPKTPVLVEAYLSESPPEGYVPTRIHLLAMLREFEALGGQNLKVTIHDHIEPFSEEATRAEAEYNIRPRPVLSRKQGVREDKEIFMGVAVTCGLEKVVVPFFDRGLPVEYELIRSICTASQQKRKRIGVLTTDAKLMGGGFDPQTFQPTPDEPIIDELKKQYEVSQVDPNSPITERFDVVLAVQPSSLGPQQMDNFVALLAAGQPTAIFEDPLPLFLQNVPGTSAPKMSPGGMFARPSPQPKGDIGKVWKLLGVDFMANDVVWQSNANPYPRIPFFTPEWVFIDPDTGSGDSAFNEKSPITSGLRQVLLPYPGSITRLNNTPMTFTPLMHTSDKNTGTAPVDRIYERDFTGQKSLSRNANRYFRATDEKYVMGAYIRGNPNPPAKPMSMSDKEPGAEAPAADAPPVTAPPAAKADAKPAEDAADAQAKPAAEQKPAAEPKPAADGAKAAEKPPEVRVVLVPDIDCLVSAFFMVRAQGASGDDEDVNFRMQNVPFVLNVLDELAGDDRFIAIRKRTPIYKTLAGVSGATEKARVDAEQERIKIAREAEKSRTQEQAKLEQDFPDTKKQKLSPDQIEEFMVKYNEAQKRLQTKLDQMKQQLERNLKEIDHKRSLDIRAKQDEYKMWAVILPPIPPLVLAFFVFFNRRAQERVGVSKERLR